MPLLVTTTSMASPISTIAKSLIRHCSDLIDEINATTTHQLQYWSWETRADEDKLPKATLFGLDNFMFSERSGLWEIDCGLGLSSYQDFNLHNEIELLDPIFDWFHQGSQMPLRNPTTGAEFDQLVVTDFEITPMVQSMLRNYRTVNISLKRTSSALA